jgi:glycerophosphoryl diester phosphodiesterase
VTGLPGGRDRGPAPDGHTEAVLPGYLDRPLPIAFAHRGGAAGHFPENSWRAFEHAVELGYAYLETDVHATADGVLVAFHDRTLDRITDGSGRIAALPHAAVAAARIAGTDPVPLLEDLLGTWPDVRFNIDVKDWPAVGPLASVLRRTAAWDRICITSFSARRLAATRRALQRPVCMATSPVGVGAVRSWLPVSVIAPRFAALSVRCAQVPFTMATGRFVHRAHAAGLQVHAWTVNDRQVMADLLDLGVDGIMTDQAQVLREVLLGRGQWHPRTAG